MFTLKCRISHLVHFVFLSVNTTFYKLNLPVVVKMCVPLLLRVKCEQPLTGARPIVLAGRERARPAGRRRAPWSSNSSEE